MVISDREIEDFRNGVPSCNWRISETPPTESPMETYRGIQCYFSMSIVHGGMFTQTPNRDYLHPVNHYVEYVNINNFNVDMLKSIITSLGYESMGFCYYWIKDQSLDYGLKKLQNNSDINKFKEIIIEQEFRYVKRIFVEHTQFPSVRVFWPETLTEADPETIESLIFDVVSDNPHMPVHEAKSYIKFKYHVSVPRPIVQAGLEKAKKTLSQPWWNLI